MAGTLRSTCTVTVIRAPLLIDSRDGTPWRDWDNAVETLIENCMVEPFPMAEKLNYEENRDREFARTALRVWVPRGTDVIYTDRIRTNGRIYDVFGDPGFWKTFKAEVHHIAFIARYRAG